MGITGKWVLGTLMGLLGLIGLFMSSRAVDHAIYYTGLLIFVFAVLFVFSLIGRSTGHPTATGA